MFSIAELTLVFILKFPMSDAICEGCSIAINPLESTHCPGCDEYFCKKCKLICQHCDKELCYMCDEKCAESCYICGEHMPSCDQCYIKNDNKCENYTLCYSCESCGYNDCLSCNTRRDKSYQFLMIKYLENITDLPEVISQEIYEYIYSD